MAKKVIERAIKFDVHDDFAFPDLTDLAPSGAHWELIEYEVEQTYYDSSLGDLDRVGVRLRRRTGGPKPGWQLRSPARKVNAEVIEDPVTDQIPENLARVCFGLAGSDVHPVSAVTIKRQIHRLWSRDGVTADRHRRRLRERPQPRRPDRSGQLARAGDEAALRHQPQTVQQDR